MYIAILGRQPAISMAELERLYDNVSWFSHTSAVLEATNPDIQRLGGTQKLGRIVFDIPQGDWRRVSTKLVQHYVRALSEQEAKITVGISAFGFNESPRDIQKTGLILKTKLKEKGTSVRLIPNTEPALSTATSHHNKLGLSQHKIELLIVKGTSGKIIVAESTGAQNITAYARRDQQRPRRDAFVGMLPPKLAQIMINLAHPLSGARILDPFCGTGVILQEASLLDYPVYGSDLSEKMVSYTKENLAWLHETHHIAVDAIVTHGDATSTTWPSSVQSVVSETYLGQPFSAPPSSVKLEEVRRVCSHILETFLKSAHDQLPIDAPLCLAVPAWKRVDGSFVHLPIRDHLSHLGYELVPFHNVRADELLYYREDQIVARELLVLKRT